MHHSLIFCIMFGTIIFLPIILEDVGTVLKSKFRKGKGR